VLQVWTAQTPQGFSYRQHGTSDRELQDFEGLALVTVRPRSRGQEVDGGTSDSAAAE
jgi:hypothetical protein